MPQQQADETSTALVPCDPRGGRTPQAHEHPPSRWRKGHDPLWWKSIPELYSPQREQQAPVGEKSTRGSGGRWSTGFTARDPINEPLSTHVAKANEFYLKLIGKREEPEKTPKFPKLKAWWAIYLKIYSAPKTDQTADTAMLPFIEQNGDWPVNEIKQHHCKFLYREARNIQSLTALERSSLRAPCRYGEASSGRCSTLAIDHSGSWRDAGTPWSSRRGKKPLPQSTSRDASAS